VWQLSQAILRGPCGLRVLCPRCGWPVGVCPDINDNNASIHVKTIVTSHAPFNVRNAPRTTPHGLPMQSVVHKSTQTVECAKHYASRDNCDDSVCRSDPHRVERACTLGT
jgi:hypothetical protein